MSDDPHTVANRIWGAKPDSEAPNASASKSEPFNEHAVAERVWGRPAVAKAGGTHSVALRPSVDRVSDLTGLDRAGADRLEASLAGVASDLGLTNEETGNFAKDYERQVLNGRDSQEIDRWSAESRRKLRERYGANADAMLADAQEFVRNDPAMASVLVKTGLGSHPKYVERIVERAAKKKFWEKK